MQYIDFTVAASQIGAVLGCFGPRKQFYALLRLWSRSPFRSSLKRPEKPAASPEAKENVVKMGAWEAIREAGENCQTLEQVADVERRAFQMLFQNEQVLDLVARAPVEWSSLLTSVVQDATATRLAEFCRQPKFLFLDETSDETSDEEGGGGVGGGVAFSSAGSSPGTALPRDNGGSSSASDSASACSSSSALVHALGILRDSARKYWHFRNQVSCFYGLRGERAFRNQYNQFLQFPIETCTQRYTQLLPSELIPDGFTWGIEGQVDGMRRGKIVEIKHRTGTIYEEVPLYERMQLHAYMFLLGQQDACLVQCIQTQTGVFSKETLVPFDAEFWKATILRLAKCVHLLHQLHQHNLARACFVGLDNQGLARVFREFIG